VAAEQWLSMAERLLSGSKGGREGHRRRLASVGKQSLSSCFNTLVKLRQMRSHETAA